MSGSMAAAGYSAGCRYHSYSIVVVGRALAPADVAALELVVLAHVVAGVPAHALVARTAGAVLGAFGTHALSVAGALAQLGAHGLVAVVDLVQLGALVLDRDLVAFGALAHARVGAAALILVDAYAQALPGFGADHLFYLLFA